MKISLEIGGKHFAVGTQPFDLSIPMQFDGPQPNSYGVAAASAQAYREGGWVGDVREGGSCNFETYTFTPHCNGTHTECMGHITADRLSIQAQLRGELIPATLITVQAEKASESADSYDPSLGENDWILSEKALDRALGSVEPDFLQAVIIRTLPNPASKRSRDYMQEPPPFFSLEGMRYLRKKGLRHLLCDLPSVDRLFDEGKLSTHHIFWEMDPGSTSPSVAGQGCTITEFIYVDDAVPDGSYILNLQIAPFVSDAAPSRPLIYPITAL